jgi:hypothetical protein
LGVNVYFSIASSCEDCAENQNQDYRKDQAEEQSELVSKVSTAKDFEV